MALIPDETIEQILDRVDIVELASRYMTLKRTGVNNMGCCPFHNEKTPSFNVNSSRQRYHCFGCSADGHAISLLMQFEGLGFRDACKRLAAEVGITIEERPVSPEEDQRRQQRERLFRVNEIAAAYFHQLLMDDPAGDPARNYMRKRGYGRKAAEEYQIGYTLDAWEGLKKHLEKEGCDADDARTLGLIRPGKQNRGDYDLFRGRLIFPIYDVSGRVVAFGARVLDDGKPKYINSPESPVYHKGRVLFGLYQARQAMRKSDEVILVEGYFDQLALYRAGFPQVVATCGTALTVDHARLLKRYVKRVVLLFDQDEAGKQATFKAMKVLQEESVPAVVIGLPDGEDPDSFVQKYGSDSFGERLAEARPVMDVFMDDCLAGMVTIEEKVAAAEKVLEQIHGLNSSLEKDLYLKELALRSGIELEILKSKKPAPAKPKRQQQRRQEPQFQPQPQDYSAPPPMDDYLPANMPNDYPESTATKVELKQSHWSRHEDALLLLLACSQAAREKFVSVGGPDLLAHPDAVEFSGLLVEHLTTEEADIKELDLAIVPGKEALWSRLQMVNRSEFCENVEQMVTDCLWQEEKKSLMKRIDELSRTLIPAAEKQEDSDLTAQLIYELIDLQNKVKSRRS